MADRVAELKKHLREKHPRIYFSKEPPAGSGFYVGTRSKEPATVVPIVCAPYVVAMSEHLSDDDFGRLLFGLGEWFSLVLEELSATEDDEEMDIDQVLDSATGRLHGLFPDVEELLRGVFDQGSW